MDIFVLDSSIVNNAFSVTIRSIYNMSTVIEKYVVWVRASCWKRDDCGHLIFGDRYIVRCSAGRRFTPGCREPKNLHRMGSYGT